MTKKVVGIVVIVLALGAFIGSAVYINGIHKKYYEELSQKSVSDMKASVASVLKPIFEAQGMSASYMLRSIEELDLSIETSPYESGFLHSNGKWVVSFPQSNIAFDIDLVFSNIPFTSSKFYVSSTHSDIKERFADGQIGVIELDSGSLALRLNDMMIHERNNLEIKGLSLVLHITTDYGVKGVVFSLPEASYSDTYSHWRIKDVVAEDKYDTPITYEELISIISKGTLFSQKNTIHLKALEFGDDDVEVRFEKFGLTNKTKASNDLYETSADFTLKSFAIDNKSEYEKFKLDIADFSSKLEIQNMHKDTIGFLASIVGPFYLSNFHELQQRRQTILGSNPKFSIKDSSFLLNDKKITYVADGQFSLENIELNLAVSSKYSIEELLERYKDDGNFEDFIDNVGTYFIKQPDSKQYGVKLQYTQTPNTEAFKVNDQVIFSDEYNIDIDDDTDFSESDESQDLQDLEEYLDKQTQY